MPPVRLEPAAPGSRILAYSEKLSDIIVFGISRNVTFIPHKSQYSFCISLNLGQTRGPSLEEFG